MPDTVVMRPADWLAITTAKATGSGEYLSGAYLAPLPELLRGMTVVLSPTVTAGKVLVVDSSQIELLVVEDLNVEIGTDADDFTKNVRTILGELRVVPTFRAVGAARLITPASSFRGSKTERHGLWSVAFFLGWTCDRYARWSARDGNRTRKPKGRQILSLMRIPIPPPEQGGLTGWHFTRACNMRVVDDYIHALLHANDDQHAQNKR